jgi:hypothetical protein
LKGDDGQSSNCDSGEMEVDNDSDIEENRMLSEEVDLELDEHGFGQAEEEEREHNAALKLSIANRLVKARANGSVCNNFFWSFIS